MFRSREINFSLCPLPTFSVHSQVALNEFSLSVMCRPRAACCLVSRLLRGEEKKNTQQKDTNQFILFLAELQIVLLLSLKLLGDDHTLLKPDPGTKPVLHSLRHH